MEQYKGNGKIRHTLTTFKIPWRYQLFCYVCSNKNKTI